MDFKEFVETHTIGEIKKQKSNYLANSIDLYYPNNL